MDIKFDTLKYLVNNELSIDEKNNSNNNENEINKKDKKFYKKRLLAVTKSLFNSWFDTKYHESRFYLGRKMKEIDKALLRIKPSYEFRRTPRSIHTSKYWKASEYRAWLLI